MYGELWPFWRRTLIGWGILTHTVIQGIGPTHVNRCHTCARAHDTLTYSSMHRWHFGHPLLSIRTFWQVYPVTQHVSRHIMGGLVRLYDLCVTLRFLLLFLTSRKKRKAVIFMKTHTHTHTRYSLVTCKSHHKYIAKQTRSRRWRGKQMCVFTALRVFACLCVQPQPEASTFLWMCSLWEVSKKVSKEMCCATLPLRANVFSVKQREKRTSQPPPLEHLEVKLKHPNIIIIIIIIEEVPQFQNGLESYQKLWWISESNWKCCSSSVSLIGNAKG